MDHDVMATKVTDLMKFKDGLEGLLGSVRQAAQHLDPSTISGLHDRMTDIEAKLTDVPALLEKLPALIDQVNEVMTWYKANAPAIDALIKAVGDLASPKAGNATGPQTPPG